LDTHNTIFLAGAAGMVGTAILRNLVARGYERIIGSYRNRMPDAAAVSGRISADAVRYVRIDLTDQQAVYAFFSNARPDCVFMAAAKVGGIHANGTYPARFIHDNLVMQSNIIHAAWIRGLGVSSAGYHFSCTYTHAAGQAVHAPEEYRSDLLMFALFKKNDRKRFVCQSERKQQGKRGKGGAYKHAVLMPLRAM
jgi:nucleoside-diphosphate-sugar epimerase